MHLIPLDTASWKLTLTWFPWQYTHHPSVYQTLLFVFLPDSPLLLTLGTQMFPHISTWFLDLCSLLPSTERDNLFLFHHHLYVDSSETSISNLKWHSHISSSPLACSTCRSYYHFKFSILGTKLIIYSPPPPNELPFNCFICTNSTIFFQIICNQKFKIWDQIRVYSMYLFFNLRFALFLLP